MEMRVQIIDDKQLKNCSICKATDEWVENICVNGIEGLYCVKCDTLTLYEPLPSKLVYLAFKKKCMQIKEMKTNNYNSKISQRLNGHYVKSKVSS